MKTTNRPMFLYWDKGYSKLVGHHFLWRNGHKDEELIYMASVLYDRWQDLIQKTELEKEIEAFEKWKQDPGFEE